VTARCARYPWDCPEATWGLHSAPDPRGCCYWCRRRIDAPAARPERHPISDLTEAYGLFYDPDWSPS
jgi:hypothetical protein